MMFESIAFFINKICVPQTSDVVAYMMDDCASLKRKHTANVDVKHFPLEDGTKIWIKQDDLSQFGNNQLM